MGTRAVRALLASLAMGAALIAAWFVPALAIVLVWPLFLFVPGWALVAVLQPRIDAAGRVGLAIVVSVAASTHLAFWLSLAADGYGREVVFAVAAILALPIPLAAWRGTRPPPWSALRTARGALVVAGLAMAVVGATLGIGIWRVTSAGVSSGGSNWSDLGVHLSIAETLNAGANFPPEVPYFAGVPLVYHWFADFHAAILAQAAGMFSVPAMVVQATLLAGALGLIVHSLARRLMRGRHARRVALLAAGLVLFGGGMGYLRFIGDLTAGAGTPLGLITTNSYDNQWLTGWPYFRIPSVMGTGLLAHRATTAGLPILAGATLVLVAGLPTARERLAGWRDRPWLIGLAGTLGALLAPFHFFFFPVFPLLALAWVLTGGRLLERDAPRNALLLLAPYALALPFVVAPALQASGSGSLQVVTGWPSAPRTDGLAAVAFFYLTNLGVPFVLAIVALVASRAPRRGFLAAWVGGLFLVPNVVQLSVVDFDMNKYFQAMWIAVALLAAWLIRRWPAPALAAVFALSVPSPLLVAGWTASSNLQVLTAGELRAAEWVAANTPPDAVFVTDGWVNALSDAAGRRRLTTFGPYVANLGYRPDERMADVVTIYCGGDAELSAQLARRHGATHLVDGGRPQPCGSPVDFSTSPQFELVYDAAPRIWRLAEP
ncbi:MAG TPA: hypothetical protein VMP86_04370 [Candidatus Binatia bacterium]|nr:hypothetical protein [Candidatus Binatia bacterium]